MTQTFTVTVKQTKGSIDGWMVQCLHSRDLDDTHPQRIPLRFRMEGDLAVATVDLGSGIHTLFYDVFSGVEIEVNLIPAREIFSPAGAEWPVALAAPRLQARQSGGLSFHV